MRGRVRALVAKQLPGTANSRLSYAYPIDLRHGTNISYSGNNCNSTSGTVCDSGSTCNVCSTCCKPYSQGTCEACVVDECDSLNVCSADASKCNTCSSCCKSYLEGSQEDCNLCVEHTCN